MGILKVLLAPNKELRKKALKCTHFDDVLKNFVNDLIETSKKLDAAGLASTQLPDDPRFTQYSGNEEFRAQPSLAYVELGENSVLAINPEIIEKGEEFQESAEGCLSLPDQWAVIPRYKFVVVQYQDLNGSIHKKEVQDRDAACWQHEIDHLNGILYPDHLSKMQQLLFWKKYERERHLFKFKK